MTCPKCNGPGGVQLFISVAPCDRCVGAAPKTTGKRRWVAVDDGKVPPGTLIGWDDWGSAAAGLAARDSFVMTRQPFYGEPENPGDRVIRFAAGRLLNPDSRDEIRAGRAVAVLMED